MFLARITIGVCLSAALALGVAGAAGGTPSPTGPSEPAATVTPVPPEPAVFAVIAWVDGREQGREVTARIGATLCATGVPLAPSGGSRVVFQLLVPSEQVVPGCGYEGATVTFLVDGQQAPQTAVWRPRAFPGSFVSVNLIIGPPFARFTGGISVSHDRLPATDTVAPYIGSTSCGYTLVAPTRDGYGGVVLSDSQQAGCGVEGSEVTFKLLDAQGNVIAVANQTAVWHAWDGIADPQHLDLTFGPAGAITMPGTGDGPRDGGVWGGLSLALAVAGVAGVAGGLAVRRGALQRRR